MVAIRLKNTKVFLPQRLSNHLSEPLVLEKEATSGLLAWLSLTLGIVAYDIVAMKSGRIETLTKTFWRFTENKLAASIITGVWLGITCSASLAVDVLTPYKATAVSNKDRAMLLTLARSRVATQKQEQAQAAAQEMAQWLTQQPRDASAWLVLSAAYELDGQVLRAIRAQAEARAMELDYAAAVDRFKAAQDLARQMARDNRLDRAGQIDAAIVDARLRELEAVRREQALQR